MKSPSEAWHDATLCPVCGRESCEDHLPPESDSESMDPESAWNRDKRHRIVTGDPENIRCALKYLKVKLGYDAFPRESRVNGAPLDDLVLEQSGRAITDTSNGNRPALICGRSSSATRRTGRRIQCAPISHG